LPPLAGFLGKFMLLRAALDAAPDTGHTAWVWAVVLVTSLFAVIALARSGSLLFLRAQGALLEADSDSASNSDSDLNRAPHASPSSTSADADPSGWLPFAVLTALLVALLVFAAPLYDAASATAAQLANPADYIDASLEARP
jgi:multicomponent K+:H+ antiporter subunit D